MKLIIILIIFSLLCIGILSYNISNYMKDSMRWNYGYCKHCGNKLKFSDDIICYGHDDTYYDLYKCPNCKNKVSIYTYFFRLHIHNKNNKDNIEKKIGKRILKIIHLHDNEKFEKEITLLISDLIAKESRGNIKMGDNSNMLHMINIINDTFKKDNKITTTYDEIGRNLIDIMSEFDIYNDITFQTDLKEFIFNLLICKYNGNLIIDDELKKENKLC